MKMSKPILLLLVVGKSKYIIVYPVLLVVNTILIIYPTSVVVNILMLYPHSVAVYLCYIPLLLSL